MSLGAGERRTTATTTIRRKTRLRDMKKPNNNILQITTAVVVHVHTKKDRNPKSTKQILEEMNISVFKKKTIKY